MSNSKQRYYQKKTLSKKPLSIAKIIPQPAAVPIQYVHTPRMPANMKIIKFSDTQYGV